MQPKPISKTKNKKTDRFDATICGVLFVFKVWLLVFLWLRFNSVVFSSFIDSIYMKCVFRVLKKEIQNKRRHTNNGQWNRVMCAQAITLIVLYCALKPFKYLKITSSVFRNEKKLFFAHVLITQRQKECARKSYSGISGILYFALRKRKK